MERESPLPGCERGEFRYAFEPFERKGEGRGDGRGMEGKARKGREERGGDGETGERGRERGLWRDRKRKGER